MYSFPNYYHEFGGLKEKFILSKFWRPEVQNKGACRAHPVWRPLGRSLPCLFRPLVAPAVPCPVAASRQSQPPSSRGPLACVCESSHSLLLHRTLSLDLGPPKSRRIPSEDSVSLITSTKTLSPESRIHGH